MRVTLIAKPGTIGIVALFGEVPGSWVPNKNGTAYVKSDSEGVSVFMLKQDISANQTRGKLDAHENWDDRYILSDVPVLEGELVNLFENSSEVSAELVQLFTVEQGADNVNFTVPAEVRAREIMVNRLEERLDLYYGRKVESFVKSVRADQVPQLLLALETYLKKSGIEAEDKYVLAQRYNMSR